MSNDASELGRLLRFFVVWEAAAVLRHDLRNKLASVRNATFYLKRKVEAEAVELWAKDRRVPTFFDLIGKELEAADAIISDRLPRLGEEGEPRSLDVAGICATVAAASGAPGVSFVVPDDGVPARGHPTEVSLALYCLVENAVDAVQSSGGGEVTIGVRMGDQTIVEILDDGPGLDAEALAHATDHFFTTRPGRLGLGLPVAKRLAGRSRGTVEIGNRDGVRGARAALVLCRT